jgi:hypothetical protein
MASQVFVLLRKGQARWDDGLRMNFLGSAFRRALRGVGEGGRPRPDDDFNNVGLISVGVYDRCKATYERQGG